MATTDATARFLCQVIGGDSGEKLVNVSWTVTTPLMITERKTMTAGAFNTITIPPGTPEILVIVPPSTNTLAITLKGVVGDGTGVAIAVADPTVLGLGASPSIGLLIGAGSNFDIELNWL